MLWNFIIDHVPAWVYIVVGVLGAGALFYFFSPILIPLWNMLPKPIKIALGALAAVFVAYIAGRNKGRGNAEEEERRKNAEALNKRVEVDREIGSLNQGEAEKRLRDRWGSNDTR